MASMDAEMIQRRKSALMEHHLRMEELGEKMTSSRNCEDESALMEHHLRMEELGEKMTLGRN